MALTEKLQILITADARGAQQEFNKLGASAEKNLAKTDDRLERLSGQMVSFGATTLVAGGVAAAGLYKLVQAQSNLTEATNKANVMLGGDGSQALEQYAETAAQTAGISKRAALEYGAGFALFAKNAGFVGEEAGQVSAQLVQLAGDISSLNNISVDEALTSLQSALAGQSEAIRRLGIDTSEATLKEEVLARTGEKVSGTLSQRERTLAIINELMRQGAVFQGDFVRTGDELANRQRSVAAEFENTAAALGQSLEPAFRSAIGVVEGGLVAFNGLDDGAKNVVGGLAGLATAGAIGAGGLALLIGTGIKVVDTFGEFRRRIDEGTGPLSRLSQGARDAEGNLTALGRAGKGLQFAAGAAGALLLANALYDLTFDAAAAEDALNRLKLVPDDAGTSESLTRLAAYGEQYKSLYDAVAGPLSDKVIKDSEGFGVSLNNVETALENLLKTDNIAQLEAGLNAIREAAALPVNDGISAELIALADRYQGAIDRQKQAAGEASAANGEQAGSLEGLADSTDAAKEASDALKGALTKLSVGQKLANLQFDVGAKRAEAFGDAIERSTNADDLLGSAIGAGRALRDFQETLGLIPPEAEKAADSTDAARETIDRLGEAAQMADPAMSELGIAMDAAAAGADAFNRSLASASGFGTQLDAAVDLGEAFRSLDRSARRLPDSIDLTAIALGELKPRQLDAIRDLRALGAATNDYLTAMLKTGASQDQVRGQAAQFRVELEAQLRQAGLSEEAIRQYVEAASLAPEQIETAIKLSGIEQSRFKLNAYLQLLDGKIPPEVATSVIAQIEKGDLEGAAATLKDFSKTNPVAIDFTPQGVDKLDEATGKLTDLPRVYDPLIAATGGYTDANYAALDSALALGDAYQDTLKQLASDDPQKAVDWAAQMREQFAKTVEGLGLTQDELNAYYELLGIAPEQVETAVKISINDAELFALTTTIDLLTSIDGLSPEVVLQLSDALLRADYEEVRRLLEGTVTANLDLNTEPAYRSYENFGNTVKGQRIYGTVGADTKPAEDDVEGFKQGVKSAPPVEAPVGADTQPAWDKAQALYDAVQALKPTVSVDIIANYVGFATQFPIFGPFGPSGGGKAQGQSVPPQSGPGTNLNGIDPNPNGGIDGNIWTAYATGGYVRGAGTGTSDDITAKLSNGEYVVKAAAVDKIGVPALNAINAGMAPAALSNDKGQAALLDALRNLSAQMAQMQGGDQIVVNGAVDAVQTAQEIVRAKRANAYLTGRAA